jgi:hypothetical protein
MVKPALWATEGNFSTVLVDPSSKVSSLKKLQNKEHSV